MKKNRGIKTQGIARDYFSFIMTFINEEKLSDLAIIFVETEVMKNLKFKYV